VRGEKKEKMKVEDAIKERRSVREFLNKPVSWDHLTQILEAAIYTPMAGNVFSLKMVVVADKQTKAGIVQYCLDQYFMKDAAYLIVVCSDLEEVGRLYGEYSDRYGAQQAGAAMQSMLLQATELGIASCWIGTMDESPIKAILGVPGHLRIEGIIALGHATKRKWEMPIKYVLNKAVYFETYGKPLGWKERSEFQWQPRETRFEGEYAKKR